MRGRMRAVRVRAGCASNPAHVRPQSTVTAVVRSTLSVSFIVGAAVVVYNLKSRFCKENAWQVRPRLPQCTSHVRLMSFVLCLMYDVRLMMYDV
jgi:hypothetical protein